MKTPVQNFTVAAAEGGQKLLQYLTRRLDGAVPPAALQKFIRTGQVRIDGKRCKPFDRVATGQIVRMPPYEIKAPHDTPEKKTAPPGHDLDILHEDDDLLVIVKPAGLPVHPGSGHPFALTSILRARYPDAPFRPTPAHRLDRDTTGVLLVAKSYRALRAVHEAMTTGTAHKDYLAWVWGEWALGEENEWLTLRDRLAKEGGPGRERVEPSQDGKEAVCKVRLLGIMDTASLVEVRLETGRTQQIRAQLASRGYPIVGDPKYGGGQPPMRLHAWRLVLPDAAFCAPPAWEAPWLVKRLRRASLAACREEDLGRPTASAPPDAPE
ncbi:MAG: pseudouridine synthase [Desulfovibrio sp.]